MSYQVIIRPEAESDLADACRWYEAQRPGLGADLLMSLEATMAAIGRSPRSFPVVHKQVRRALLRRFPYGVFYIIEGNTISVLAVFHAKRDPRRWQERT